jgi:glucose dehydrogenase
MKRKTGLFGKPGRSATPMALAAFGCTAMLAGAGPALAADLTYERLVNPEPQNWLMNHHDYTSQRFSARRHQQGNVRNLRLLFAIALGGTSTNGAWRRLLVEDGFMYMVDSWGIVSKIDVRSGTAGRFVWKMDPKLEKQDRNRGVALWQNLVISVTGYAGRVIATDKETGAIVWDKSLLDQADLELTAAPLALKDSIVIGGSGGDRGLRNWVAALDPKTGDIQWKTYSIPAPASPQRDLEGQSRCMADRRRRLLCHGRLRSRRQPHLLGLRQRGSRLRPDLSSGRQSLHVERDRLRCRQRQDQVVPPIHAQRQSRL